MQNLYDYVFKQLEISIREIGYGDASINKKMKNYINLFYSIINQIENWDKYDFQKKNAFFSDYLNKSINMDTSVKVLVSYHPSTLIQSPKFKKEAWSDLQMLQKELNEN